MFLFAPSGARAQGCIVARSTGSVGGPESEGGYLQAGHWELELDYRHQFSFRHYVGDVEQTYRFELGNQVENKINLENMQVTYQLTPRWSFFANVPVLFASRRANDAIFTYHSAGIGDTILGAQRWMWDPQKNPSHNIQITAGLQIPTGDDNVQNAVIKNVGDSPVTVPVDYSIQPGTGGWGLVLGVVSFQNLGKNAQFYFNGGYIITPQNTTGKLRNPTATSQDPLTQYASISDEYLVQTGLAYPISSVKGLTLTFGPRFEGVPAHDLIGKDLGFRRPGFALSLEPGFQYTRWKSMFAFSVGRALWRARVKSVPDIMEGKHGDAAFADWVWLASLTHRF
ncbi:MAG TPA: hypothetical protein VMI32_17900 [Candidatus Solibacter sp.]|nr:hypothetical protein [Candidatus Solibacter sp.]